MSVRAADLSISAFTLDGVNFLATWRDIGFETQMTTVPGQGGSQRYEKHVETKRDSTATFTIEMEQGGVESTNLSVTVFTFGSLDFVADWKNFSINYSTPTVDGSGGRDLDTFANYVSGSALTIQGEMLIPATVTAIPAVAAILSGTASDRLATLAINFENSTTSAISMPAHLSRVAFRGTRGDLHRYDVEFRPRGAPTAPTGTHLLAKILTGTGTDSLISLAVTTGSGGYTANEACVTAFTVNVSDGEITTANGTLQLRGAPSFS